MIPDDLNAVLFSCRSRRNRAARIYTPAWCLRRRKPSLGLQLARERAELRLTMPEVSRILGIEYWRCTMAERDTSPKCDDTPAHLLAFYALLRAELAKDNPPAVGI